jgi:L-iditol 2-dehydrogenase
MKTAVYYGRRDIRIEEAQIPEIKGGEILVRMKACGVCGSDLMDWYLRPRVPLVLGHEPAGVVAERGNRVTKFEVGDRVFVHHHVACLTCHYCLRGDYTLCRQFHETNIKPGGFAEYFSVPAANVQTDTLRIPEQLSYEQATFIEPVACCIRAVEKCRIRIGDTVVVIGAGTTGLVHTALSKIYGATSTIVSDVIDMRLKMAKKYGADITVNPKDEDLIETVKTETEGRGADIVIVTASNVQAYKTALSLCRKGGKLCIFAPTEPEKRLDISPEELFFSELQVIPSYSTSHLETRTALELLQSNRIDVKPLVTHRFDLLQTGQALETASQTNESLKVIVTNQCASTQIARGCS